MSVGPSAGKLSQKFIDAALDEVIKAPFITAEELYAATKEFWNQHSERQARRRFNAYINSLQQRGLIVKSGKGFSASLEATSSATQRLNLVSMRRLQPIQAKDWDGKWHMVSFDIPEEKRAARAALRRLLKQLGCKFLHGSVWVHILDYRRQIQTVQQLYGITSHITYLVVDDFDRAEEYKPHFKNYIGM